MMAVDPTPTGACAHCGTALESWALSCPACRVLIHADELQALAERARHAEGVGDLSGARDLWRQAAPLLPPETVQFGSIQAHLKDLDRRIDEARERENSSVWRKRLAGLGPLGVLLWKLKVVILFALTKGKLLLLGFTKLGTVVSMFTWVGVYCSMYGWKFACWSVLTIYVHEMGHVIALRHYHIPAGSPLFIPGLGAFVELRTLHIAPVEDARVGLAGPLFGLGATAVALAVAMATDSKAAAAIAHFSAVINLLNLVPVWQLDGSRGFHSLMQWQRVAVIVAAGVAALATQSRLPLAIAAVGAYRLFTKDASAKPDHLGLLLFVGALLALSAASMYASRLAAAS